MGLTATFSEPYYSSEGASSEGIVPRVYPVALDGIGFLVDDRQEGEWHDESIPMLRAQSDQASLPSQESLNPEAFWRLPSDSWHHGAGQEILDFISDEADPFRFRNSKGLNVWDRFKLSLLPDTERVYEASEANTDILLVGSRLYVSDGVNLKFTDDGGDNWTSVTGAPATNVLSYTTDGFYIYATTGADVYRFDATTGAPAFGAAWNTLNCSIIKFVKGRLLAAQDNILYEITSSSAPSAHYTHPNANFNWVDFAEGPRAIYAAGKTGTQSLIYRISILEDGSGLDQPLVTGDLPEEILSLGNYLGFVFAGTDIGIRFMVTDSGAGDLSTGALLETGTSCYAFAGSKEQVWFGWDNYDVSSTGLGRFALTEFADLELLAPAYASDLMAVTDGEVFGIVHLDGEVFFSVSDDGVYKQTEALVESGYIESGEFNFGFTGLKTALYADIQQISGSHEFYFKEASEADYTATGTADTVTLSQKRGNSFEYKLVITEGSVRSVAIRAQPMVKSSEFQFIPVLIRSVYNVRDSNVTRDPVEDLNRFKHWRQSREIIACAQGQEQFSVIVEDYVFNRKLYEDPRLGYTFEGTLIAKLKVIE